MSVNITSKAWILALFIRDDGERFVLGKGAFEFKESQQHFVANNFVNDVVDIQGNDGQLLAGQVRRASAQPFNGYVGDFGVTKEQTEIYRRQFFSFFQKNHFYTVVYVFENGDAIKRQRGYITDAPEVQEIDQKSPEYHVALNFEDVNYYPYAEDAEGEEIMADSVDVDVSGAGTGGLIWDSIGVVWDAYGATWEVGSSSVTTIINNGISDVYPIWRVGAGAINPQIENLTTGTTLSYQGNVVAGQELVVDSNAQTAKLSGLSVIGNISGQWIRLAPGVNRLVFRSGGTIEKSTVEWSEVVG